MINKSCTWRLMIVLIWITTIITTPIILVIYIHNTMKNDNSSNAATDNIDNKWQFNYVSV